MANQMFKNVIPVDLETYVAREEELKQALKEKYQHLGELDFRIEVDQSRSCTETGQILTNA